MAARFAERGKDNVKEIDAGVKNVFKWEWMEFEVDGQMLGQFIRKLFAAGKAHCTLCQKEINYASRGRKALESHCQMKIHLDKIKTRETNYSLPGESNVLFLSSSVIFFIQLRVDIKFLTTLPHPLSPPPPPNPR